MGNLGSSVEAMETPIAPAVFGKHPQGKRGFTLVELLVVIGIIALLISVLLPALHAARGRAQMISCASNLRQLAAAALTHSQEHQGYFPLAGELVVQPGLGSNKYCEALTDSGQRRYTWSRVDSPVLLLPAVLPAALGKYLGVNDLPMDDVSKLDVAMTDMHFQRLFACPSTESISKNRGVSPDGTDQALMIALVSTPSTDAAPSGQSAPRLSTYSDYGYNEGLLGYHYDFQYKSRRLRGQISSQKRTSELVLFTDAKPRSLPGYPSLSDQKAPWIAWTPAYESLGAVSLGDAFDEKPGIVRLGVKSMFDLQRHDGQINVAFADGHVDAYNIMRDATHVNEQLRQAYLLLQ